MKNLIFITLVSLPFIGLGQCVKGNCENGVGTYIGQDGSIYNGTWKNGQLNGLVQEISYDEKGTLIGTFDGEMEMDEIVGWGTETLYDVDGSLLGTYVGEWKDNDYNGWGIWIWDDGTIEKGYYKDGELIDK